MEVFLVYQTYCNADDRNIDCRCAYDYNVIILGVLIINHKSVGVAVSCTTSQL